MLLTKQTTRPLQDIYVNQMQISCLGIFVRYSKFLVGEAANIDDIPESAVVIPVSRPSDTSSALCERTRTKAECPIKERKKWASLCQTFDGRCYA